MMLAVLVPRQATKVLAFLATPGRARTRPLVRIMALAPAKAMPVARLAIGQPEFATLFR